jgi:uncharacterized protein
MDMKVISRNGEFLAVNLENLALFIIDENEATVLSLYQKGVDTQTIASELNVSEKECRQTIELFCSHQGIQIVQEDTGDVNQLLLMVALDCNMKCSYCYGDGGTYKRERTLMTTETALKALDAVSHGGIETVTFFGGEPLLNFELIKNVVRVTPHAAHAVITNGTIMNREIAAFIKTHNITTAVSIDGPEEVHDSFRVYPDGRGTHKKVMETVRMLKASEVPLAVEATYTKRALELGYSAYRILEYLYQFTPSINISPAGFFDTYRLSPQELTAFYLQCIEFTFDKIEEGIPINIPDITSVILRMASPERVIPRLFCPYYARRVAVFPNGDVYPCCLLAEEEYNCGNVSDPEFSSTFLKKKREVLSRLCRDRLVHPPWFTPLLTRICVSDVQLQGDCFALHEDTTAYSDVMEYLLYRIATIEDWGSFFTMQQNPFIT